MNAAAPPAIGGNLFTDYFLREGMPQTAEWRALNPAELLHTADALRGHWRALAAMSAPNEATTERTLIEPAFALLGWEFLPQQSAETRRRDIPDALLFRTHAAQAKAAAIKDPRRRYAEAAVVVENEARDTLLDRANGNSGAPASQILRYLALAEPASGGAVRWGLLTNGRYWRLYWHAARSRAEGFVGFDLPAMLDGVARGDATATDLFRTFFLLFRREAFDPTGPSGATFVDTALAEGRRYEERITAALSDAVFKRVFRPLVQTIAAHDPQRKPQDAQWRQQVKDAALILLYRLLFLLYAEDRELLPVRHPGYAGYALQRLRQDAAAAHDEGRPLSGSATRFWTSLVELFRAIADGEPHLGLPPYNGGLFDASAVPLLTRVRLPDDALGKLLDELSREEVAGVRRLINFRDLSVQHLGSIYERLLEFDVVVEASGIDVRLNPFARKNSGSYYTPDELVRLIIRRTVGPLIDERRREFADWVEQLASDRRPRAQRIAKLREHDPAQAFLSLRVLDPAMGSGHFLVSLVDWLTDQALTAQQDAAASVSWADYRSPLNDTIERIRTHIEAEARQRGWEVRDEHLDDRHLVRRIVLKRVIYGVDLNPMAVELAMLSLWLHSFTVGAPLSFLDHHLRCGDSLFGEFVHGAEDWLRAKGRTLRRDSVVAARNAAAGMQMVEALTDADIAEVKQSKATFGGVEEATAPLYRFLDLVHAERWLDPLRDGAESRALASLYDGLIGDPVKLAAGLALPEGPSGTRDAAAKFLGRVRELAVERRFLHWQVAFPGVWDDWESITPRGGFDAVIGNPPWDRIKLQEVEWFAARVPEIALAQRAADRKKLIGALQKRGGDLAADYGRAVWTAEAAARVGRGCGDYPLLGGGDANVYSLFVERASHLVKPEGIVGLLVPSGIAADKGAAKFFSGLSSTGRLSALFDFENRRTRMNLGPFFPDIDSRFKFSALIFGGNDRRFLFADCAFFQQDADEAEANAVALTPADFAAVNPNTGTAPVFRTRRDAEITVDIYRRFPVLVDRRGASPKQVWPVHYLRMFDMTNDSALFRTAAELEKLGAYRVAGNRWRKGEAEWLALYEGKMVQAFDHRAASVSVNPQNLNRPAQPEATTLAQHRDATWSPTPQFWLQATEISVPESITWTIAFKDVTAPTNMRTMIAAAIPRSPAGNTLPLLLPEIPEGHGTSGKLRKSIAVAICTYAVQAPLLLANLNSYAFDFVARQKVQGQHLNFYIVEQLPMIPPKALSMKVGPTTAEAMIRDYVLRLTYTAHDMAGFATDLGHTGPPFAWDEEERLHLRARLDALFFLLYGLDRDAARYILSTFPIVRAEEAARYQGRFRSHDLILGYMAALAAGDPATRVAG
jgi:hypothetical protein